MNQISTRCIRTLLKQPIVARSAVCALALIGGTASAQTIPNRYPITPDLVIVAMAARQLPTEAVQIKLAAPVTSSSSNPVLEIEAVTRTGELGAQLRVVCQTKHDCLPFYVAATWPQSSVGVSTALALAAPAKSHPSESSPAGRPAHEVSGSPLMRSGTPATLLIEDHRIHIRMQVVCLEDGATGANIRVTTPDHKQSYRAEVLAPNLLKGSF